MDNVYQTFRIQTWPRVIISDHPHEVTLVPTNPTVRGRTFYQLPQNAGFRRSIMRLDHIGGK